MIKRFAKNIISFYLNFLSLFFHKKGAVVLMYHSIGRNNVFSTVSPENFEKQLCFLKKNNFNVITLSDFWRFLDKEEPLPKKTIILTFDDGYYDNFSYGWPILKRYKFKATIFLTTGLVGGVKIKKSGERLKMLSWQEIEKMQKSGIIDFQPHTQSHPRLTEISPELIQKEIGESKQSIEQALVKKAEFFAYPYGDYNEAVVDILKTLGFKLALTVKEGRINLKDNPFYLKRKAIFSRTSFSQFKAKVNG